MRGSPVKCPGRTRLAMAAMGLTPMALVALSGAYRSMATGSGPDAVATCATASGSTRADSQQALRLLGGS